MIEAVCEGTERTKNDEIRECVWHMLVLLEFDLGDEEEEASNC